MLTNTRTPEKQHIHRNDFFKPPFRPEPYAFRGGHFVGEDGFVVPNNFQEFSERYPNYVERWVRSKCKGATIEDMQDWSQDLLLHLSSLPPMSRFREAGKTDVIETFDPARHHGANQRRFLNFVNICLANKLKTLYARRSKNPLCHSGNVSLSVKAESDQQGVVDDEYCHSRSAQLKYHAAFLEKQRRDGDFVDEFAGFVQRWDSRLLDAMNAIAVTTNSADAAALLGVSSTAFNRIHTRLRCLATCFIRGQAVPKQRKPYQRRVTSIAS